MNPKVSIILTLYNIKLDYVKECIKSILNQTYQNFEIICMDDCSTLVDYSSLSDLSDKIKLYRNEINLGLSKNVNKAFSLAKGEYIVRLGSDDYFDKNLLKKEVKVLDSNHIIGAVCCELKRYGLRVQHIKRPHIWTLYGALHNQMKGCGYAGGMMFRRKLLNKIKIDESLKVCEDYDFHLQILKISKIKSIHEPLYFYRSHDTNIMKSIQSEERRAIIRKIRNKYLKIRH